MTATIATPAALNPTNNGTESQGVLLVVFVGVDVGVGSLEIIAGRMYVVIRSQGVNKPEIVNTTTRSFFG